MFRSAKRSSRPTRRTWKRTYLRGAEIILFRLYFDSSVFVRVDIDYHALEDVVEQAVDVEVADAVEGHHNDQTNTEQAWSG